MTRYIGLDARSESCTVAVLGGSGKRLRHERFQTSAELLKRFIKEVPRPRHLCIEEGTLSEWLCEELSSVVDKLVVGDARPQPGQQERPHRCLQARRRLAARCDSSRRVQGAGLLPRAARSGAHALRTATRQGPHQEPTECAVPRVWACGTIQGALRVEDLRRGVAAAARAFAAASGALRARAGRADRVRQPSRAEPAREEQQSADRAEAGDGVRYRRRESRVHRRRGDDAASLSDGASILELQRACSRDALVVGLGERRPRQVAAQQDADARPQPQPASSTEERLQGSRAADHADDGASARPGLSASPHDDEAQSDSTNHRTAPRRRRAAMWRSGKDCEPSRHST